MYKTKAPKIGQTIEVFKETRVERKLNTRRFLGGRHCSRASHLSPQYHSRSSPFNLSDKWFIVDVGLDLRVWFDNQLLEDKHVTFQP